MILFPKNCGFIYTICRFIYTICGSVSYTHGFFSCKDLQELLGYAIMRGSEFVTILT